MNKIPSYLDIVDDAFFALTKRDKSLGIDGRIVHPDLPQRFIPAAELRSVLLHPSTTYAARDAALVEVMQRAQDDESWKMVTLGMLIPGLKRAGGRLARNTQGISVDIDAELVTGVLEGLDAGAGTERVAAKLLTSAVRRARRLVRNQDHNERARERLDVGSWETASPEIVLDQAVEANVITQDEAELIAASRIAGYSIETLADEYGVSQGTLRTRRNRAERRLRSHIERNG